MKSLAMCTYGFKDAKRTDDVGLDKRPRVIERVVVVTLSSEVHDHIVVGNEAIDQR